jgi:phosphoribosyl 1,2-cyclic phosphate phosphodiesterase
MSGSSVTILGCGASAGVPMIGCDCAVCTSENPKNKRLRASIAIEKGDSRLLVDASPDLRQQTLSAGFKSIDGIWITHAHADHCHGIDDIRSFNYIAQKALPVYSDAATLDELQRRFDYVFRPPPEQAWYRAALTPHVVAIDPMQPVQVTHDITIVPFQQIHGKTQSIGIRIDNFAYSTDVNNLPEESLQTLENLDVWLVDCLSVDPSPTHAHLEMTLGWIERVKPKRAILTHMGHSLEYEALKSKLPPGVEPGFDGMKITL